MKKKRAKNVIDRANDVFRFTVLLESMWAWHAECNAMRKEVKAHGMILKFAAIVTLNAANE